LDHQNHTLTLKLVHKLHEPGDLPWKTWFLSQHPGPLDVLADNSFISRLVHEELSRYCSITTSTIGDGRTTSSWCDKWLLDSDLANTFPALFSHCTHPNHTVQTVLDSFGAEFRPRLSCCAAKEKQMVEDCLLQVALTDAPDCHSLLRRPGALFSSKEAIHSLQAEERPDADALHVWRTSVPTKVKFFEWLFHHDRLNTRASMYHRNIRELEDSYCEQCPGVLDMTSHIFLWCPTALAVWEALNIVPSGEEFRKLWLLGKELQLPVNVHTDLFLLVIWDV
jgi:hypothetical protein